MTLAMRAQGRTTLSGEAALRLGNLLGRQDLRYEAPLPDLHASRDSAMIARSNSDPRRRTSGHTPSCTPATTTNGHSRPLAR